MAPQSLIPDFIDPHTLNRDFVDAVKNTIDFYNTRQEESDTYEAARMQSVLELQRQCSSWLHELKEQLLSPNNRATDFDGQILEILLKNHQLLEVNYQHKSCHNSCFLSAFLLFLC